MNRLFRHCIYKGTRNEEVANPDDEEDAEISEKLLYLEKLGSGEKLRRGK